MQSQYQLYKEYSSEEFLLDEIFLDWVKAPTEEKDSFWKQFLLEYPEKRSDLETAKRLAGQLQFQTDHPEKGSTDRVWNNILQANKLERGRVIPLFKKIWWAAAILLIMATGYFLWRLDFNNQVAKNSVQPQNNVTGITPGGNNAVLILADGSRVVLDTAANGTVARQGSVTVVKLDGQLAYNREDNKTKEALYNTITTPRGGQYQLVLADGTKVWLNAASSLRFPTSFPGAERKVELTGEGYFEVAHNAQQPFHVLVKDMDVQVLGTSFNVSAYPGEGNKTTLLEGRVMVNASEKELQLAPGEQAVQSERGLKKMIVDAKDFSAWKDDVLVFKNAQLVDIMKRLGREYDYEFEFQHESLKDIHYTLVLSRPKEVLTVLKYLAKASPFNYTIKGNKVFISNVN